MMATYCPYDVTPLARLIDGVEFTVETVFGRVQCFRHGVSIGDRGTVFVHGVHDDMASWGPLVRAAIGRGVDLGPALFVDLPGFGRSENRRGPLDITEVGDVLLDIAVSHAGLSALRIVGHSMGTLVVADMAARHAAWIESLHLAAGPYYSVVEAMNGRLPAGLAGGAAAAIFGLQYGLAVTGGLGVAAVTAASRAGVLRPLLSPYVAHPHAVRQSVLDHLVAGMRPASFRAAARNGFRYRTGMSWAKVQCPVWAVYGTQDRLVPAVDARRLLADIPAARVTRLADASHLVHIEQPDAALLALGLA